MSKIFLSVILVSCINIFGVHGQGTINGFSHIPAHPTPSDSITFFIEVSFTSGSCNPDSKGINVNGFNEDLNTYYSSISNISEMKDALNKYSGTKNLNKTIPDSWPKISKKHIQVYEKN